MPHKRNPIGCEQITGLARLMRANAMAALENVALWHERDISHSSVERVILPDSFIALDHMLRRFTRIVAGMVVYPERMMENLRRSRGVVFSGTVLLELARRGVSREQAYEWVQRNAMRSFHEQRDFKELLLADADVTRVLPREVIDEAFDLDAQLRHVDDHLRPGVRAGLRRHAVAVGRGHLGRMSSAGGIADGQVQRRVRRLRYLRAHRGRQPDLPRPVCAAASRPGERRDRDV